MEKTTEENHHRNSLGRMRSSLLERMRNPVAISIGVGTLALVCCGGLFGGIAHLGNKSGEELERKSKAVCDYGREDNWYRVPDEMNEDETLERLRGLGYGGNKPLELGRVSCDKALLPADLENGSLVTVRQASWIFDTRRACMAVRLPEQYEQPSRPNEIYAVCSAPLTGSP